MEIVTYSKRNNPVGKTTVTEVKHSAGYYYTQYGPVSKHQKGK